MEDHFLCIVKSRFQLNEFRSESFKSKERMIYRILSLNQISFYLGFIYSKLCNEYYFF